MLKFILIGRQASGKSHFLKQMENSSLRLLKSHTNRPKRFEKEDTYIFEEENTNPPENALALAFQDEHFYYTTKEDVILSDVMILTPKGAMDVAKAFPSIGFYILYICPDEAKRKAKLTERRIAKGEDDESVLRRELRENTEFESLDNTIIDGEIKEKVFPENIFAIRAIRNNYEENAFQENIEAIISLLQIHENMEPIIEKAIEKSLLKKAPNEKNALLLTTEEGEQKVCFVSAFTQMLLQDPNLFNDFMASAIARGIFNEDKEEEIVDPNQMSFLPKEKGENK